MPLLRRHEVCLFLLKEVCDLPLPVILAIDVIHMAYGRDRVIWWIFALGGRAWVSPESLTLARVRPQTFLGPEIVLLWVISSSIVLGGWMWDLLHEHFWISPPKWCCQDVAYQLIAHPRYFNFESDLALALISLLAALHGDQLAISCTAQAQHFLEIKPSLWDLPTIFSELLLVEPRRFTHLIYLNFMAQNRLCTAFLPQPLCHVQLLYVKDQCHFVLMLPC